MTVYRDAVPRVSLAAMRAAYRPRDFRRLDTLTVDASGVATTVRLVQEPSRGAFGGLRRWALCPRCGRRTSVIGLVVGEGESSAIWSCARSDCGAWKSRKRLRLRQRPPLERA